MSTETSFTAPLIQSNSATLSVQLLNELLYQENLLPHLREIQASGLTYEGEKLVQSEIV